MPTVQESAPAEQYDSLSGLPELPNVPGKTISLLGDWMMCRGNERYMEEGTAILQDVADEMELCALEQKDERLMLESEGIRLEDFVEETCAAVFLISEGYSLGDEILKLEHHGLCKNLWCLHDHLGRIQLYPELRANIGKLMCSVQEQHIRLGNTDRMLKLMLHAFRNQPLPAALQHTTAM